MWLKEMREQHEPQIMIKDIVPVIQTKYPKYDAQLHSKVERLDSYGIELCKEAENVVREHFNYPVPDATKLRRSDKRTLPCRIQCRIEKAEYDRLQIAIREDGFDTVQDWLRPLVVQYLSSHSTEN